MFRRNMFLTAYRGSAIRETGNAATLVLPSTEKVTDAAFS